MDSNLLVFLHGTQAMTLYTVGTLKCLHRFGVKALTR